KGNPKKNPLIFFYEGFPLTVSTASNIKNILIETEIPTKGGAGMAPGELARKARGIFRETAFWQAVVRTDERGRAEVKFTLPDNLTTWQTETLGLTKDTKLGVNYLEFVTKKELMVIPLKPRFVVPGDVFQIGAQIFNQSKETQKLNVKLESQTLVLKDNRPEKEIILKSDETATVLFKVEAPSGFEKEHEFLISAKNKNLEDVVFQSINVTPNNTYEVTAASNYTDSPIFREYVFLSGNVVGDKGGLTIKSNATLAVFLSDALNYLLQFPYGCSEQIASRLNAIAIVKRGLNLPNMAEQFNLEKIKHQDREYSIEEVVEIGLAELYNNQQSDGGFSFWRGGRSDFY
ncbi:MAG: alpha-2-macroglobulin family protein, partial [Ignavibacteria bacterium]|nr:alpha-2-macroglobulin family protein [Ignavibacteria bacterium]